MCRKELYLSVEGVVARESSNSLTWLVRGETDGAFVRTREVGVGGGLMGVRGGAHGLCWQGVNKRLRKSMLDKV